MPIGGVSVLSWVNRPSSGRMSALSSNPALLTGLSPDDQHRQHAAFFDNVSHQELPLAPGSCQSRTRRHARIPLSGSSGPSPRGLLCLSMTHAGLTDGTVCRKFPLDHEAIPSTVQEETTSGSERRLQSAYRSRIPLLEQGVGFQIPRPSIKSRLWLGAMTGQWSAVRQPDIQRFDKPTTQPSVLNHPPIFPRVAIPSVVERGCGVCTSNHGEILGGCPLPRKPMRCDPVRKRGHNPNASTSSPTSWLLGEWATHD